MDSGAGRSLPGAEFYGGGQTAFGGCETSRRGRKEGKKANKRCAEKVGLGALGGGKDVLVR